MLAMEMVRRWPGLRWFVSRRRTRSDWWRRICPAELMTVRSSEMRTAVSRPPTTSSCDGVGCFASVFWMWALLKPFGLKEMCCEGGVRLWILSVDGGFDSNERNEGHGLNVAAVDSDSRRK